MDKLSGLSSVAALLRASKTPNKTSKVEVSDSKKSGAPNHKISLDEAIQARLKGMDQASDEELVEVFIKGTLGWEFGDGIESDASYRSLLNKLMNDIEQHPSLKKQVLNLVKALA